MLARIIISCAGASIGVFVAAYNVFYLTVLEAFTVAGAFFGVTAVSCLVLYRVVGFLFAFRRRSLRIGAEFASLFVIAVIAFFVAIFVFDSVLAHCKIDDLRAWYCR